MTDTGSGATRASIIPSGGVSATCGAGGCGGGALFGMGFGLGLIFGIVLSIGRQGANAAALASADWAMSLFGSSELDVSCGGDSGCGGAVADGGTALSPGAGCGGPPRCGAPRMVPHPDSAAAKPKTAQNLNRFMMACAPPRL
jgi:hypothetical protein